MANKTTRKIKRAAKSVIRAGKRVVKKVFNKDTLGCLDPPAQKAAKMLLDPCNAEIAPSCYRGHQGYKTRFVANLNTGGAAGQTAVVLVWNPSRNENYQFATADTSATVTYTPGSAPNPGQAFIVANADSMRCLGACMSVCPIASVMNTSGFVHTGLVSRKTLFDTSSTDGIIALLPQTAKVDPQYPMEVKFVPGAADELYSTVFQDAPTGQDESDALCLVMVLTGLPAATGVRVRYTTIVEWVPNPNLGIPSTSQLGNPSVNTIEHVKQCLIASDPHWWTSIGKIVTRTTAGFASGGIPGAILGGVSAIKL